VKLTSASRFHTRLSTLLRAALPGLGLCALAWASTATAAGNPALPTASAATTATTATAASSVQTSKPVQASGSASANSGAVATPPAAPSSTAQKLYTAARQDLLQIRVLVKSGRTQASVGSGFLIGHSDLVVTNYHVVSQIALEPKTYVAEFIDTEQKTGAVELLAVDAIHDLAVVRIKRFGHGVFEVPEHGPQLIQGQYLYSLGNPLDLGFAISEGTYNGVINRSLHQHLLFTGSINAGMSGGPNITVDGQVAGVNVAKRRDGELVSFLVPVDFVYQLLQSVAQSKAPPTDFKKVVGQQLLNHQRVLADKLQTTPLQFKTLGPYQVPVWESDQMRCWGRSEAKPDSPFTVDTVDCNMDSSLYISDQLQTGAVTVRHQMLQSRQLDALRFSRMVSQSFRNEAFGGAHDPRMSTPQCTQMFVTNQYLPLRAVMCVRAYRQFSGLYDFALLTSTTNNSLSNLQSRFDVFGVSYENGLRITRLLMEALGKNDKTDKNVKSGKIAPAGTLPAASASAPNGVQP
jgi:S1-C subfamily serine protease